MRDTRNGQIATAAGATSLTAAGTFVAGPKCLAGIRSFHQIVAGTGTVTAAYTIDGSNDGGQTWINLYTNSSLNGTAPVPDSFVLPINHVWDRYRVNLTAISGTNATFTSWVCEQVTTEA